MMHVRSLISPLIVSAVVTVVATGAALAYDKPSANAKPIPAAELKAAYSGKTLFWPDKSGALYWAPDGSAVGYSALHKSFGDGTWKASNGKVCYDVVWLGIKNSDKPYPLKNCFHFMRDGTTYYHQFSSNKMKSDTGWWKGKEDLALLKPGNLIQKDHDTLKAMAAKN